jgi:hypothetical protein
MCGHSFAEIQVVSVVSAVLSKNAEMAYNDRKRTLFGVDTYYAPILTAYWLYAEARQGSRDMQRVGVAV